MLSVTGMSVRYGLREALSDVSFTVNEGELVTLIGANGAGKTTCLKTISGLLKPSKGRIEFLGQRIDGLAPHRLLAMGLAHVPEGRLLFPEMTVMEHLELGAVRARPETRSFEDKIEWNFTLFPRLKERRDQRAGTLSGGEQQMVAIARGLMSTPRLLMLDEPSLGLAPIVVDALADVISALHRDGLTILLVEQQMVAIARGLMSTPRLLLLDEPSLGLAPIVVDALADVISALHRDGLTILLVEQRVDLALKLANRGYVLETGRVALQDSAAALLQNPQVKQAYLGV